MKSKRSAPRSPAPPPKKGRGRPAKSDQEKWVDKAKAALLALAYHEGALAIHTQNVKQGLDMPIRKVRAMLLEEIAKKMHKSPDTIRDLMKPERRVLRKKAAPAATSKKPRRSGAG